MKATQILTREHVLILQMLAQLSRAREKLEKKEQLPVVFFKKAILFSQNFADRFHHFKEEFLMFGLLAQKKEGVLDAEIGALRYQHERCRSAIAAIDRSLTGYVKDDEMAITTLLENVAAYISLLTRHIYIEDHVFFPMIETILSKEEQQSLLVQFQNEELRIGKKDGFSPSQRLLDEMRLLLT
jgi:hemerythrin-like domain-containing protein